MCAACGQKSEDRREIRQEISRAVKLMTLDPGHFHAALVQKTMYSEVDSNLYVFAPQGPEVQDFLDKISAYNTRGESPTHWNVVPYLGDDYLEKMLAEKPGNVMIVAGKNSRKVDYILAAVNAGLNVYADKPLVINPSGYQKLKEAFKIAAKNKVLIYDIMTERFEATTALQKLMSTVPEIFGELENGSPDEPSVSKESIHHFFKNVSGQPLVRPPWFFDVEEEGEGIVDVTTHLVDLVQWELFPDQIIDTSEVQMIAARRWPTILTREEFQKVTGLGEFPDYLKKDVKEGKLYVYCNGEMLYKIKGRHARVSVTWNFEAPEGTTDTHHSVLRGTRSNLIIKQGETESYKPTLYIESRGSQDLEADLKAAVAGRVAENFPGTSLEKVKENLWRLDIPEKFKPGHEAHFAQVTENYLEYLKEGKLPEWEVPNMISKYFTTMAAYRMAQNKPKGPEVLK